MAKTIKQSVLSKKYKARRKSNRKRSKTDSDDELHGSTCSPVGLSPNPGNRKDLCQRTGFSLPSMRAPLLQARPLPLLIRYVQKHVDNPGIEHPAGPALAPRTPRIHSCCRQSRCRKNRGAAFERRLEC